MNKTKKLQFSVLIVILLILIFFSFYFQNQNNDKKKDFSQKFNINENQHNLIKGLQYKSQDQYGNLYIIKSEESIPINDDNSIVILKKVSAEIKLRENDIIKIFSDYAKFNVNNNNTHFYDDIKIM